MPDMKNLRELFNVSLAVPWKYDKKLSHLLTYNSEFFVSKFMCDF